MIDDQEVPRLAIAVKPNLDEQVLKEGPIKRGKLALVVTAVNPFLKRTEVVSKVVLSGPAPDEVELGAEVLERLGGGSNMTVQVALCLVTELDQQPGKPFMLGHWLAKKSFDLRPPKPAEDFGVEPMNDAGWKAMNLPAKTLYYVQYYGHVNEPASKDTGLPNYGIGARSENLLYRLWLRADLVLDEQSGDRYHLAKRGQIDFYRSHLFRQGYANARNFARALLRFQYPSDDAAAPRLKVDDIRELVKRLRRLRANLFLEILDEKECRKVIEDEAGRLPAAA